MFTAPRPPTSGLLLAVMLAACTSPNRPSAVPRPSGESVNVTLRDGYRRPELSTVTALEADAALVADDKVMVWRRTYDGVEVGDQPRSALVDGTWVLRRHRELAEPEPVRVADLTPLATSSGDRGRLVYLPEYAERALVASPRVAADVELVISGYRLVYELREGFDVVRLDAYDGTVVERESRLRREAIQVAGLNYIPLTINVTRVGNVNLLRDPARSSLLNTNGTIRNGQGIVNGSPEETTSPLDYKDVGAADAVLYDAAFALEQSWDFFSTAFGRRGLRNLQPSATTLANDSIIRLNADTNQLGLASEPETGLILVNDQGTSWREAVTIGAIAHEWAHSIFFYDVNDGASPTGENAGLNEANSYFFAMMVRARALHAWSNQLACQQDPAACEVTPPVVEAITPESWRYEDRADGPWWSRYHLCLPSSSFGGRVPAITPAELPLDRWAAGSSGLDGHLLSGPINRMQCLLARGVLPAAAGGELELHDAALPRGFAGLGSEKTSRLWWAALHVMHGYPAPLTFTNARSALLKAAEDAPGMGKHSPEYKAIEDAFAAIAVDVAADRDPPAVSVPLTSTHAAATLDVTATDLNGVGFLGFVLDDPTAAPFRELVAAPGTALTPPFQVTLPSTLSEGPHTLWVVAEDTRKNRRATSFAFLADNTPPTATIADKSTVYSSTWSPMRVFGFDAFDDRGLRAVRVLLDGVATTSPTSGNLAIGGPTVYPVAGQTSVSFPQEWVNLKSAAAGPHVIAIEVTDDAGNVVTRALPAWSRDTTAPSQCVVGLARGTPWQSVSLTVTAKDVQSSLATVKFKIDGVTAWSELGIADTPGATFSKTITTTVAAGSHTFTVQCIDEQGNSTSSVPTTLPFGPPPSCSIAAAVDPGNWARIVINSTASSSHLTLDQVRYDLNGVNFAGDVGLARASGVVFTGTRTTGVLGAGTHTVVARCIDNLTQSATSNAVTLTLTPPPPPPPSVPACNTSEFYGNGWGGDATYEVGRSSGHIDFTYFSGSAADAFRVLNAATGQVLFDTGCITEGSVTVNLAFSGTTRLRVQNYNQCGETVADGYTWQLGCATP